MKNILLLINLNARSAASAAPLVIKTLEESQHNFFGHDEWDKDFKSLIMKYQEQTDLIVLGGGDGTINQVLPALVECKKPLVLFPLGTTNLLARSLGIKADLDQLIQTIENGKLSSIDLGKVNDKYFINVCGLGISTEVNRRVSAELKRLAGPLAFWITGLKIRKSLKPFKIKMTLDDLKVIETRTWQVTICNGRKYGAWMTITPEASYQDGLLHCLSTEINHRWEAIKLLPSYLKGDYKEKHNVTLVAGKRISIESRYPLLIDVDGDVQTSTPAVFEVCQNILNLIIPHER